MIAGRYNIVNPAAFKSQIDRALEIHTAEINGTVDFGCSLSQLVFTLRDNGFKFPSNYGDQEDVLKALGYRLTKGKVGKWTKGGWQYCSPAVVVTLA